MKFCDFRQCKQPVFSGGKCFNHRIKTPLKRSAKTARRKRIRYGRKEIHDYTKTQVKKDLDIIFSAWVRMKDAEDCGLVKCKSCEVNKHFLDVDNGHYISRAQAPNLIFNEMNVAPQCRRCNGFLEGNATGFRRGLVKDYGEEKVQQLESLIGQKSGIGLYEYKILLLSYIDKFKAECKRLYYSPNITQQRVLDRWENK